MIIQISDITINNNTMCKIAYILKHCLLYFDLFDYLTKKSDVTVATITNCSKTHIYCASRAKCTVNEVRGECR